MSTFTTRNVGRIYAHILPHTRFRTKDLIIRLHTPLQKQNVTAVSLLPYMWMNGTKTRPSTRELMIAADNLYGTVLRTSLGKRGAYHVLEATASIPDVSHLTDDDVVHKAADLACGLLLDHAANEGAFTKAAVAQEIDLHRRRIEASRDDKMSFALQRCLAEVAEGTPVALPRLGFIEDLATLSNDNLYDAYRTVFDTGELHVYLVGPFADASSLADKVIAQLQQRVPSDPLRDSLQVDALAPLQRRDFRTVRETQDVMQAQLDVGYRTGVNFADDAYPSFVMMNGILGGFAHSKLFRNVREKHSLAYNVWSHFDGMTGVLAVMTGIEPSKYSQALDIIQEQLATIQAGEITDEEMDYTLRGLVNQYTVLLDQPAALANWHYNGAVCGQQRDIPELMQALRKLSKDDIVRAASQLEPSTIYFLTGEGEAS